MYQPGDQTGTAVQREHLELKSMLIPGFSCLTKLVQYLLNQSDTFFVYDTETNERSHKLLSNSLINPRHPRIM